jgi:nitroimidazol reductase NimA-like FMN-containing flavoprotein (pyridoxamine 5'-phosphate oxidase superfamily)
MSAYGLEEIHRDECDTLLRSQTVGRVGVDTGGRPAILPVRYALLDGDVVLRTAPGEKLVAAMLNRTVPFEIDDHDDAEHTGWSVLVVGRAEEVVHPDEVARCEALGLEPWAGEARDRWVRIRAEHVTGRRVHRTDG